MLKLLIANWKMEKSDSQALAWCTEHKQELLELLENKPIDFVLCPSASFLTQAQEVFRNTHIILGAQDCGPVELGNYTGDISVLTLQERGVKYGIIGHSERRIRYCESNNIIAQKAGLLLAHQIIPVLCVGETTQDRENGSTEQVLAEQILPIIEKIKNKNSNFCIAYEPVWAIGTGKPAAADVISKIIRYIKKIAAGFESVQILYGGSVNSSLVEELAQIEDLDGYLIGKSSLDFQMLKKIVLSVE